MSPAGWNESTSTPRVILSSSILLIRPNRTLRKSRIDLKHVEPSTHPHSLIWGGFMVSARESKLYLHPKLSVSLHFRKKKGNNLNYLRCCEWKLFSTSAALQRLLLQLLAFSPPVVHLFLNISHTENISINTVMRGSQSGNSASRI